MLCETCLALALSVTTWKGDASRETGFFRCSVITTEAEPAPEFSWGDFWSLFSATSATAGNAVDLATFCSEEDSDFALSSPNVAVEGAPKEPRSDMARKGGDKH